MTKRPPWPRPQRKVQAIGPKGKGVTLKGKLYKPTVFRIEDHYEDGRIKTCTMIHDDTTVSLEDESQRHFLIAFVNEEMLKAKAN